AVLDLGSASFQLVIADVKEPTSTSVITDKREDLALGRAVGETGRVDRSSADTAISVAKSFAAKAERRHATDLIVVATSALRIASNGERLLERIEEETGHEVRALSGDAEAILAYVGARGHAVDRAEGYRLDREALRELERRLLGSPRRDRIAMPGMSKRRVDSVGPGAVVLSALMETLGVPSLTVSPWGFREGIMLATLRTGGHSVLVRMEAEEPAA